MEEPKITANMEIYDDKVLVSINPKIYPIDIVYSAAYAMLDCAHVVLDGDPEEEIIAEIWPKKKDSGKTDLNELGNTFNDELVNYAVYKKQAEKNAPLRHAIIQKALLVNGWIPSEGSKKNKGD